MAEKQKIIVVTGAGTGIGKATAQAFLAAGWGVVLAGRRAEPLREAAGGSPDALAVPTDVSDPASVEALFAATEQRFGRCDALFNNAGMSQISTPFGEISIDTWRQVVDVNLNGMFYCARAAFNLMRRQDPMGGRIINNGSISAHVPRPGSAAYTATKHAVTGLTRSISLDGRAYDIACGQIDIGNAASDMTQRMTSGVPQADGTMKVEPRMDVAHVAETVLHMASLPLATNIQFVTVMATKMPYIGRG